MKKRILSSIVGIALILLIYQLDLLLFIILCLILCLLMCREYLKALQSRGMKPSGPILYFWALGYYGLLFLAEWRLIPDDGSFLRISLLLFCLMNILLILLGIFQRNMDMKDNLYILFGFVYLVFLSSFLVLVRKLPGGDWIMGYVLLGAFSTDIFSFLIGSWLGKRKILPHISPSKTMAGFVGGYLGCLILLTVYSLMLHRWTGWDMDWVRILLICLLSGLVAQVGDWIASYIKRQMQIKDFGTIMPGHGGILDRLDSVLLMAPLVYFLFAL